MQTSQGAMLQSLRAVQGFLNQHADRLNGIVQSGARKRLDDAVNALEGHAADQTGHTLVARGLTQKQRTQRTALLRDHMVAIARIARADLPNTPEFAPLRMPRGRPTLERLAAAADGMAQAATPFADMFVKAGLPQDFLAQLTSAATDMLSSTDARTQTKGRVRGATAGVKAHLSEGRKVVHILDAFVQKALKGDESLIANWNLVKRVPRNPGRAAATATMPLSTPAAPTPPSTPT